MENQQTQNQAANLEPMAEVELPLDLVSETKGFWGDLSRPQMIKLALLGLGLLAWYPMYRQLKPFSNWVAYDLFRISPGTHLGDAVSFFFLDIPKVFMLLVLVVFGVGILRSFFTPERTRGILAGKREISRGCHGRGVGGSNPLLLLFRSAAVHRLRGSGHSHRRYLRLPDLRPHGE